MKVMQEGALLSAMLLIAAVTLAQQPATLEIDAQKPIAHVSPTLYGLMTEEINHSYDGGLYAELIRNRGFLDAQDNEPGHWSVVRGPGAHGSIQVVATHPLTDKLPHSLE